MTAKYRYIVESNVPLAFVGNGTSDIPALRPPVHCERQIDYNGGSIGGFCPNVPPPTDGPPTITAYRLREGL